MNRILMCLLTVSFPVMLSCSDNDPNGSNGNGDTFRITNAFPNIAFDQPVFFTHAGDGSGLVYVVERKGRILTFLNDPETSETSVFLDITSRVNSTGGEQGLLGLAFHPSYASNGSLYINYISQDQETIIAEVMANVANNVADVSTENIVMVIEQPFVNHNAGMLAFGDDGYLYIGTGDGGSGGDPFDNAQNRQSLLGKMLRIDIDGSTVNNAYDIPADNPFVGNTDGFREEIFAYGLRNPWRYSFDAQNGELWVGDVGQNRIEEVDKVISGGNYGWNIMEGTECFEAQTCEQEDLVLPVATYDHDQGNSITGGYVYRGAQFPELRGFYFYGDFGSGSIWTLNTSNISAGPDNFIDTSVNISSFGVDGNNELYIVDFGGEIFKLSK